MAIFKRPRASYHFTRLAFKAEIIEPLRDSDEFEIVTPEGRFVMTKRDFYRDFGNVAKSMSYRERGLYHYPTTPHKALKYLR